MDGAANVTPAERLMRSLPPWRWWISARLSLAGVRVNPSAVLLGRRSQIQVGPRCVLGARVRIDTGSAGCVRLGSQVWLASDTEVETNSFVGVGSGTTVQRRCTINGTVQIDRGCIIAPNVFISSGNHPFRDAAHLPIREQERLSGLEDARERPVWIQDDCWLGVNVVVSPGVTVGKGSVVGANSVVTGHVRPYSVVAGAPAREVGTRLVWSPPARLRMDEPRDMPYVLAGGAVAASAPGEGFKVSAAQEFQAALASSTRRALVHYRASSDVEIRLAGNVHQLQRGSGVVEAPVQELMRCGGEPVVGVRLLVCGESSLEVMEISGV